MNIKDYIKGRENYKRKSVREKLSDNETNEERRNGIRRDGI